MSLPGEWFRRIAYVLQRSRRDASLREEIAAHRAMMAGPPSRFGNPTIAREDAHAVWGWGWLDDLARDVRLAARMLARTPGFTAVALLSLALATGATTAIFSVVNAVLLRPLPLAAPDRLVQVRQLHGLGTFGSVSFRDLQAYRDGSRTFERFTGFELSTRLIQTPSGLERLTSVVTDGEFFDLLGAAPVAGRVYRRDDGNAVMVISEALWQRMFNRDPATVGRAVTLKSRRWNPQLRRSEIVERAITIIGVMPERFQFPYGAASVFAAALPEARTDMWIPEQQVGVGRVASLVGRLAPGATVAAAQAELTAIMHQLPPVAAQAPRVIGVQLTMLADEVLAPVRLYLWLLFGAVALVLAAACANVANLLLARTAGRVQEIATRAALGAAPARLARQFLAESLLLAIVGGAVGLVLGRWSLDLLATASAARIPRAHEIALDWRTFVFMLLICTGAALFFGLAPALIASRTDAQTAMKEAGRTSVSRRLRRLRDGLVIAEVALAFVLAFGAVGVIRELGRLQRMDPGMRTDNVMTFHLTATQQERSYFALAEELARVPGVRAAGFTQILPLQNWGWVGDFHIKGRPESERPRTELRSVTPGYFEALGIPVRGRTLTEADADLRPPAILINEALARLHFKGEDPIGRELDRGVIVGVVADVKQANLGQPAAAEVYGPLTTSSGIAADIGVTLLVRTEGPPEAAIPAMRAALRAALPTVALFNVRSMAQVVEDSLWELTLYRQLVGLFALLALTLAAIGLYGVIAYGVSAQMREFAVRLALGSEPRALARLVVARGLRLSGIGLAVGAAAALGVLPLLRRLPATITPDAVTFAGIAAALVVIALTACLVPALRVAAVNPAAALRRD